MTRKSSKSWCFLLRRWLLSVLLNWILYTRLTEESVSPISILLTWKSWYYCQSVQWGIEGKGCQLVKNIWLQGTLNYLVCFASWCQFDVARQEALLHQPQIELFLAPKFLQLRHFAKSSFSSATKYPLFKKLEMTPRAYNARHQTNFEGKSNTCSEILNPRPGELWVPNITSCLSSDWFVKVARRANQHKS